MTDDDDDEAHSLSRWSLEARQTASQTVFLCQTGLNKLMNIYTVPIIDFVYVPLFNSLYGAI